MGGAASIEVHHSQKGYLHINDKHFQELLSSKSAREQLFQDIAKFPVNGKADRSSVVNLLKLAAYFTNNSNSLYSGFQVNVDTVNAAFKFTVVKFIEKQYLKKKKTLTSKKKAAILQDPKLTRAMIHSFLPNLLLFMRVWDIFDAADKLVVEDKKIFKGEFLRIKESLNHVHGISICGDTPKEDWDKEFDILDKNNDKYISFEELCTYAIQHIKKPFDYNPEDDEALLNEVYEEEEAELVEDVVDSDNTNLHFVDVIGKLPEDEVTSIVVADIPATVDNTSTSIDTNKIDSIKDKHNNTDVTVAPSTQEQITSECLEDKEIGSTASTESTSIEAVPTGTIPTAVVDVVNTTSIKQEPEQAAHTSDSGRIMLV